MSKSPSKSKHKLPAQYFIPGLLEELRPAEEWRLMLEYPITYAHYFSDSERITKQQYLRRISGDEC